MKSLIHWTGSILAAACLVAFAGLSCDGGSSDSGENTATTAPPGDDTPATQPSGGGATSGPPGREATTRDDATPDNVAAARSRAEGAANASQAAARTQSYEDFKASVYKEPGENGKYIVNGDTPILNEKRLKEFYSAIVQGTTPSALSPGGKVRLVVHQEGGEDARWSASQQRQLTYCVSDDFGPRYATVVAAMDESAGAWEAVADVDFIHATGEDGDCDAFNPNVVFDIRPVENGGYLARAFFPHEPRHARNVLVDGSSFELSPGGALTLEGIMRHELGHTLGFRHEHTRPESGACFEDDDWRPLTEYDAFSVMHYPQCNGLGDWGLTLTAADSSGAACLYGAAEGFDIDPEFCDDPGEPDTPAACAESYATFAGQSVAKEGRNRYGPFSVAVGSTFKADMVGSGDPDLYVRFGQEPDASRYACRPYLSGATESCALDVPSGQDEAFVMVRGYTAGDYTLSVSHVVAN